MLSPYSAIGPGGPKYRQAKAAPKPVAARPTRGATKQAPADPFASALAPLFASIEQDRQSRARYDTGQQGALKEFTDSLMQYLRGIPAQVGNDYDQAIRQTDQLAQTAAAGLRGSNPNASLQSALSGIGAPAAQAAQLAGQNQQVFGGGAATLYDVAGKIPGTDLAGQKAAQMAFASELPGIQGLTATQAFKDLLAQQGVGSGKFESSASGQVSDARQTLSQALAKQRKDQATLALRKRASDQMNAYRNSQLGLAKGRLSLAERNQQFDELAKTESLSQGGARVDIARQRLSQDAYFKQAGLDLRDEQFKVRTAQNQAKLSGGGFTTSQVSALRRRAGKLATEAYRGKPEIKVDPTTGKKASGKVHLSYQEGMTAGLAQGIPLTVMQSALNHYWRKPGFTAPWEKAGSGSGRPLKSYQQRSPQSRVNASYSGGGGDALISLLKQAGFKGEGLRIAYGIAMRESGGRPDAYNGNLVSGDRSWGLFQINTLGNMISRVKQFGLKSEQDLLDPLANARAAYQMSRGGRDFGSWGIGPNAYRSGAGMETIRPWGGTV